jgi:hypothetical protein
MTPDKRTMALGFAAGLAVAIACSNRSLSTSADAGPADTNPADTSPPDGNAETPPTDRLRVRTADTDADQTIEGSAAPLDGNRIVVIVDGPAVITDIWSTVSQGFLSVSGDARCESQVTRPTIGFFPVPPPGHGLRIGVKAGEFLCLFIPGEFTGTFSWSGYRPYAAP